MLRAWLGSRAEGRSCFILSNDMLTEKQRETSMVDLTYQLLEEKGEPMLFHQIVEWVASQKGFSSAEKERYKVQLYTEINLDGRFVCMGRSLWGLKHWYPLDQTTDSAVAAHVKDDYVDDDLEEEEHEEEIEEEKIVEDLNTEDDDL